MTETPEDRTPEEESDSPGPEVSEPTGSEQETDAIPVEPGPDDPTERLPEAERTPQPIPAGVDAEQGKSAFRMGATGRRVAVGASVAVAFLCGMVLDRAIDDHDSDQDRASFVAPGGAGLPDGPGSPNMPGGPGGGPGWSYQDDDHHSDDHDDSDDDDRDDHDEDRYDDEDRYEHGELSPGNQTGPENSGPGPMQSGQS